MPKILPTVILPNITSDGTNLTIPIADIPGLTAAEADPATGNGAELLRLICDAAYDRIEALATTDRPTQMTWGKPPAQGVAGAVSRQTYTFGFNFTVDATAVNIATES